MDKDHGAAEIWHPQSQEERDAVLGALQEILNSPQFRNSKRYPALLRYVVEKTLEGKVDQLKERTLGTEVFGRPLTYEPSSDTVVRYTASEVRKRLLLYYSESETASDVRILLPPGSYIPEFHRKLSATAVSETKEEKQLRNRSKPVLVNPRAVIATLSIFVVFVAAFWWRSHAAVLFP